jgi:hypothetical protein
MAATCWRSAASAAGASSSAWPGWAWCWPVLGRCCSAQAQPRRRRARRTPRWSNCAARSPPTPRPAPSFLVAACERLRGQGAQAVVLRINSPGGSPVQAGIVNDEIRRLKALHNKKVYAVVEEMCASGRLLHRGGGRRDLRRQGQHRRQHRRADGRLRLHRARWRSSASSAACSPPAQQGHARPLLAGQNEKQTRLRQGHDRPDPPAVHRRGQARAAARA